MVDGRERAALVLAQQGEPPVRVVGERAGVVETERARVGVDRGGVVEPALRERTEVEPGGRGVERRGGSSRDVLVVRRGGGVVPVAVAGVPGLAG